MTDLQFRVRRLAVVDLHGSTGSALRLWLVRVEFVATVIVSVAIGCLFVLTRQLAGIALGIAAFGIAANYFALAVWALKLRRGRLTAEFKAHDVREDGRAVALGQWRLFIPFLIPVLAARRCERIV